MCEHEGCHDALYWWDKELSTVLKKVVPMARNMNQHQNISMIEPGNWLKNLNMNFIKYTIDINIDINCIPVSFFCSVFNK